MSTRCTINFADDNGARAKIYRHSDGYPDGPCGVLADMERFFDDVETETSDTRFNDPCYLAAKFVVWQASRYAREGAPLDFLSVGVCLEDPGDIEFTYDVVCVPRRSMTKSKGDRPEVTCREC